MATTNTITQVLGRPYQVSYEIVLEITPDTLIQILKSACQLPGDQIVPYVRQCFRRYFAYSDAPEVVDRNADITSFMLASLTSIRQEPPEIHVCNHPTKIGWFVLQAFIPEPVAVKPVALLEFTFLNPSWSCLVQ